MKVATYIAKFLKIKKINTVFTLQGGTISRILDSIHLEGGIKIVSMHHEQSAAMAADAYSRITNKPGIALATSGPGATNLLTGIGNCYFDSVPAIFITGQVNIAEQKGDSHTRQLGFQETDIVNMARPITKEAIAIKNTDAVISIFEKAFNLAISGRQGPVLVDIPMNIQNEEINDLAPDIKAINHSKNRQNITEFFFRYLQDLENCKRPLILVGRGIRAAGSVEEFILLLQNFKIPVVTSLLGLDVLPFVHPQRIGFIGTYGNRWANYALDKCDLLLVLGSRMDVRQTGSDIASFQTGKKIYHVDVEPVELNNRIKGCVTLESNLNEFFTHIKGINSLYIAPSEWVARIEEIKLSRLDINELDNIIGINPNVFIHQLSQVSKLAKAYICDVGNHQMWCAQSLELEKNQQFLTSAGMGAMGYALPAAIGASFALGKRPVVCIAGDGGFQINIQELQTIRRNRLPIKIVILNNYSLGMIRQFQDSYFESRYTSSVFDYDAPEFAKLSKAYGIESFSISRIEEIEIGLSELWKDPAQPFLLEVSLDIFTNAFPKIMFGKKLTEMEPQLNS